MIRALYVLLFVLAGMGQAIAQTGEIQGKVTDEKGEGIPFANVAVFSSNVLITGSVTDFDGKFTISALTPGNYDVEASYQGNKTRITGITVSQGIRFLDDIKLSSSIQLGVVEIKYEAPLVDQGNTTSGGVVTKEEIRNIPTRNVNSLAATKAGVYQSDEGAGLNVKGSRGDATEYIIDGVRVSGSINLPQNAIEQLQVITGGVDARYGDATGGFITITTRGPANQFNGEVEGITSQFLDGYGYNLGNVFLTGPISRQYKGTDSSRTRFGFFVAAEYLREQDPDPAAVPNFRVRDNVLTDLFNNPLRPSAVGSGLNLNSEFITMSDLEEVRVKQNIANDGFNVTTKFDYRLGEFTNLTFGGTWRWTKFREYQRTFSMFNYENNPLNVQNTYRGFLRFTQRFPERKPQPGEKASTIGNAYYSVQVDYTKFLSDRGDARHGRNAFDYGFVGQFDGAREPVYFYQTDSLTGLNAYTLVGFRDTSVNFTPGNVNPGLTNYTLDYFNLTNNLPGNLFDVQLGGGLLNGDFNQNLTVYSMYYNTGVPWFNFSYRDDDQFSLTLNAALDIKSSKSKTASKHSLEFGFEFQQRVERFWGMNPLSLWTIMRQLTNQHIRLDNQQPILVIDGQSYTYDEYLADPTLSFGQFDTINYQFQNVGQTWFDQQFRDRLNASGFNVSDVDFVRPDAFPADFYSLDMFSADELLNNGNQLVFYNGFDYTGARQRGQVAWEDFFLERDANGNRTRRVDAFRPIYSAAYIQDRFNFNDIVFRVGLRVDRYDANRKVLRDQYTLYQARSAGEVDASIYSAPNNYDGQSSQPGSIGDDFVVYVDNPSSPTPTILGYRDDRQWYNAAGEPVNNPLVIATQSAGAEPTPYLVNPNHDIKNPEASGWDPNSSFVDYEPQVNLMPRIAFSFPISKEAGREALFFAHYDVLTQRPQARSGATPYDYFFLEDNQGPLISNPNLRPERTIDYQIGFQQQISDNSVVKLAAFYRELRDMVQILQLPFAYPITYTTFGNIDFGTIKGLSVSYEIARRVKNIKLDANYTLQFADGTGSNATSQINLVGAGQPNLRTILPLSYDSRHTLRANVDYRYGEGESYDGPRIGDKDIFSNAGVNMQFNARSGEPFSRQQDPTPDGLFGVASRSTLDGRVNGSRLPWHFRADLRVDKSFFLDVGQKNRSLGFNVYVWVQNLFNNANILAVYGFTGNPDDDGFLSSDIGQVTLNNQLDPETFETLYDIKINNPDNFTIPRRVRLGVSVSF
jgi:hypothetical protein